MSDESMPEESRPETKSLYDDPQEEKPTLYFLGTDLAKIPCFKTSTMNGVGGGAGIGVLYNLATSRSPAVIAYVARFNTRQKP